MSLILYSCKRSVINFQIQSSTSSEIVTVSSFSFLKADDPINLYLNFRIVKRLRRKGKMASAAADNDDVNRNECNNLQGYPKK